MNTPAFTASPWRRAGHRAISAGLGQDSVTLCEVFSGAVGIAEADANEALIAAAPALYLAAAEVLDWIEAGCLAETLDPTTQPARLAACRRAVQVLDTVLRAAAPGVRT